MLGNIDSTFLSSWFRNKPVAIQTFIIIVILPTVIASLYYGFIVSDIFIAETRYSLRSTSDRQVSGIIDAVLSGGGSTGAGEDTQIVRDYILSRDMLEKLDNLLDLREYFQSTEVDIFSRIDKDASLEDFLDYYRNMIVVKIDNNSQITTLLVKAFDAEMAKNIASAVIEFSEALVNSMSERIIEDTLRFAREEVDSAEIRVRKTSNALTQFRSKNKSIDPGQETSAVLGIVTGLEHQLASAQTELTQTRSYMQEDSPQVIALISKVKALENQVVDERKRLTSGDGSTSDYTSLIDRYEPLLLDQKLAEQRYASAITSLEIARAEAHRKRRYLITFVEPRIPEEPLEPRRITMIFTIFTVLSLLYGIGGLIWSAIKDHMRI